MYAESMELFSLIINLAAEFAKLARTLVADGIRFIALLSRSRTALAAENLFLRKQLAFYQERKIKPRRFDNVTRYILVLLSHGFAWNDALTNAYGAKIESLLSSCFPIVEIEHTTKPFTTLNGLID